MAFDFPDAPVQGDLYEPDDGIAYLFSKGAWRRKAGPGSSQAGSPADSIVGDVKASFDTFDHNGWFKLDGRAISTLPLNAQSAAQGLGFAANLPDANDAVLRQTAGAPGTVVGSWNIAATNIPSLTSGGHDATAVTSGSAGAHVHGFYWRDGPADKNIYGWDGAETTTRWASQLMCGRTDAAGGFAGDMNMNMVSGGSHTHTLDMPNHTHAVGNATPTPLAPKTLVINLFCYLGS